MPLCFKNKNTKLISQKLLDWYSEEDISTDEVASDDLNITSDEEI